MKLKIIDFNRKDGCNIKTEDGKWRKIKRVDAFNKMIKRGWTNSVAGERMNKHGESGSRLFNIWCGMKSRCGDGAKTRDAFYYKDRGIRVFKDWHKFSIFRDWAKENGYKSNLTLERIDVNGGYFPGNCKWIPSKDQNRNKRNNHRITINGETKILDDWSREYGIKPNTITTRILKYGWDEQRAVTTPVVNNEFYTGRFKKYKAFGRELTLSEWNKITGIPSWKISERIKRGWKPERALGGIILPHTK